MFPSCLEPENKAHYRHGNVALVSPFFTGESNLYRTRGLFQEASLE